MTELTKQCIKCSEFKPVNRDYFGSTPNGNTLRGACRLCMRKAVSLANSQRPHLSKNRSLKRQKLMKELKPINKPETIEKLTLLQDNNCYYCSQGLIEKHLDHKTPISKGGTNDFQNFALTCPQCNHEKHNKTEDEHWAWREKRTKFMVSN
jgi:hypothetical protein